VSHCGSQAAARSSSGRGNLPRGKETVGVMAILREGEDRQPLAKDDGDQYQLQVPEKGVPVYLV